MDKFIDVAACVFMVLVLVMAFFCRQVIIAHNAAFTLDMIGSIILAGFSGLVMSGAIVVSFFRK